MGKVYYNYLFKSFKYTKDYKESELGFIPREYNVKLLSEVTSLNKEKVRDKKNFKVLSAVKSGDLQLSEEYFNKNVPSAELNKYIIVNKDDYAYNPARINIGSIGRNKYDFESCVSPVYVSFKIDKKYKYFFDFYFKGNGFNKEVNTRASGSVRQTLKYVDFGLIKLVYPDDKMIEIFNDLFEPINSVIQSNEYQNKILEQIRDTLLPKLMNGEIDLDKGEI